MTFEQMMKTLREVPKHRFSRGMAIWLKTSEPMVPESRTCSAIMFPDMTDTEGWELWLPLTEETLWDCIEKHLDIHWIRTLASSGYIVPPEDFELYPYNPHWPF